MKHRLLPALVVLLILAHFAAPGLAEERPAVGVWTFEGSLVDRSGRGNDAFLPEAQFGPGHSGQGLRCDGRPAVVPDSPELRPAPGLRLECWVKLDALGPSWQTLLFKQRAYQLRVDPPQEGGRFAFFLNLDGWEPRVRSAVTARPDKWYHVVAGWDGKEIWIDVDGQRAGVPRAGTPLASGEPLELGPFKGMLDEVRIENPAARAAGVAHWLFDGDLRDSSGHGNDLSGKDAQFVPVPGGQALKSGSRPLTAASRPQLQLSPGFRIDCSIFFDKLPAEGRMIVMKNNEYQLRLNSAKEESRIAFFVYLDGWEPRVTSAERIESGRWYRLTATWDGAALVLDVNGQRSHALRSGLAKGTDNPLVIGGLGGLIDNLKFENPRLPMFRIRDARQEHAILLAGRSEKMTTTVCNLGTPAADVKLHIKLPAGVRSLGQTTHDLGAMPTGAERTIAWGVESATATIGHAEIEVTAAGAPPAKAQYPLVFFPSEDGPPPSAPDRTTTRPAVPAAATTFYIDSAAGNNAHAGTSPETAWKDFTNINGRTLGPGERLLLRRGSVFRQELSLSAHGDAGHWAEIGAFGDGARPILCRSGDIDDRCALVRDPDFLRIHSLVVCRAGKGLIVNYSKPGHRGLLIEDCIAHHIEGLYRFNSHGIPEWLGRRGAPGDAVHNSPGIAIAGALPCDVVLRDCEMFQCSSGYFVLGEDVLIDRVFCHDNFAHNTSPHPFLVEVRRALLRNCVFDASGWHAHAGTMGIMLGNPQGLIIRNCWFRNQPDSGSHDEGGIDFENRGNGCLIDRCTFENNAGAAIEVLGLQSPQTTNVEVRDSRFICNNSAKKLGPAEIYVWGQLRDPAICCSTGTVRNNGYVLLPGIEFFVNEAPRLTSWTLHDNKPYANVAEIDRGMPLNRPPVVDAGPVVRTNRRRVSLAGSVKDDGRPAGKPLTSTWEVLDGPGRVTFADVHAAATTAEFSVPGDYTLRLVADDGELWSCAHVAVHILPPGTTVLAAWEFNKNLDKEGWTEANLGTHPQQWPDPVWPTTSDPVKMVAGGQYVVAVENSTDAHLLSPDHLNVDLTGKETLTICMQNHTPATQMRVQFTTDADTTWNAAKSRTFTVTADDNEYCVYRIDLPSLSAWKGRLRQLRLDLATGQPLTGTCRIDYVWITSENRR